MGSVQGHLVALMIVAAALVVVGCGQAIDETERSATGVITAPGRLGLVDLRPGDCIRDALADEVGAVIGVPCAREHRAQVVAVGSSDDYDFDDTTAIDEFCTLPVEEIGRRLLARDDLPQIGVALLFGDGGNRAACVLEFAEPITEDLVRATT